jgi:hypothetical protein
LTGFVVINSQLFLHPPVYMNKAGIIMAEQAGERTCECVIG